MPNPFSPTPLEILRELLAAHDRPASIDGDRVVVAGHPAWWSAEIFVHEAGQLQLDVRVHLPGGLSLIESFAGTGETPQLALGDAYDTFCKGTFHPLLNAFFDATEEVTTQPWQLPSGSFQAAIGDATFRGQPPGSGQELVMFFDAFAQGIQSAPLPRNRPHWLRIYYAQHARKPLACEVLLNNLPWTAAQQAMAHYPWVRSENFYSVRLFLVLQPGSED